MKTKNIFKIILFILLSGIILISLSGCSNSDLSSIFLISLNGENNSDVEASSNLEIDTSFDEKLSSINNILEKNEKYASVDSTIKNLKLNSYTNTLHIFCKQNNDKQNYGDSRGRMADAIRKVNLHLVEFLSPV